ncbi:cytochrome c oxidase assembly protein subunit 15 [Azorhizobium sp. AG788]|uniref:COX15/CtaA family protein n=1 Tax=Azorhizobium sp. AG788 TaxID=2183897 RepID=UPI0010E7417E|nr:COX15/CtaA family protein [Azorhizobium sp. AG788]TDT99338.1 cytochrome c oxidase assembly protein subunit 15 [Azorhizobium sp. AG788]
MSQAQGMALAGAPVAARSPRAVQVWLYAVAALIVLMVVVGGATRLTESGLSITEWKPITGALPPLSEADWQAEFDRYKTIPQYEILNKGMGLEAFKTIYWWEWGHRLLGRVIGLAFFLPFLYFALTGALRGTLLARCFGLFLLGGLQGAVGWWMVASGLTERTSVSQYRLAVHLTLACIILTAIVAVARSLSPLAAQALPDRVRLTARVLVGLVLLQTFAGGLVAGLDAGMSFNTWPLMDGHLVPAAGQLGAMQPLWRNLFENAMTVQFVHRSIAYLIFALAFLHLLDCLRLGGTAARRAALVFALVAAQAMLGILTLVHMVPLDLALAHQLGATLVLIAAMIHASDSNRRQIVA